MKGSSYFENKNIQKVKELMMTSNEINGEELDRLGVLYKLTNAENMDTEFKNLIENLNKQSFISICMVKQQIKDGLNDHRISDIGEFFDENFSWMGNTGCGTKKGLREFQDNWQKPFQEAFSDKVCIDEARLFMGEWAAAFGRQEAIHSGEFMGIPATGKKVQIKYMDFWWITIYS